MNVSEAIRTRKSVRTYRDVPVPRETIERILDTARFAPSARNLQEWRVVAVTEKETIGKLAREVTDHRFIGDAPVVLAVCAEADGGLMRCGVPRYPVDVAIFIDHITLVAVEEGLGTCWIGGFDQDRTREILGIPPEAIVVELLPMGYPADPSAVEKKRKGLDRILSWERW